MEANKNTAYPHDARVWISIGSNTPDREERMSAAIKQLEERHTDFRASDTYTTPCCNGAGPDYLNAVATFSTSESAEALNATFKEMESETGREHGTGMVTLDIDLVIYGDAVLRQRDFDREYFRRGYNQLTAPDPRTIEMQDFVYDLPDERIAKHPLPDRDRCKLLVANRTGVIADSIFANIGDFLPHDTLLIYNNTRVINARLRFRKPTGGIIEIFCLEPIAPADYQQNFSSYQPVQWKCLVGNSKRWKDGVLEMRVPVGDVEVTLRAERVHRDGADSAIRFSWDGEHTFARIIEAAGEIPVPPYLNRATEDTDSTDYQTVYSRIEGSVAAPTAGLHFTDELLESLTKLGIERREVTLHVGAGTFQPVKSENIGGHDMHAELIDVDRNLIAELAVSDRPVTAVGTTSVRTLESLYHIGCKIVADEWTGELDQWYPYSPSHPALSRKDALTALVGWLDANGHKRLVCPTRIIIAPGYKYRVVRNLVTNFHQPGSTLLLLVSALIGDTWHDVYAHAMAGGYRFLSYGDACLFLSKQA